MPGALFNIVIPTKQHEIHLSQKIACDCSIKTKLPNDNTNNKQPPDRPKYSLSITMEKTLEAILCSLQISNSIWNQSRDNRCYSVTFSIASNEHCEHILNLLMENGIGVKLNSTVVVLPCSLYYQDTATSTPSVFETNQHKNPPSLYESSWKKFLQSVKSRLTVAQVVQGIETGAMLTFDFVILLIISVTDIGSLWVSIVLAFLVGIAVPIALLGNNTFSLVGVAISTSLLPPSVNAGLLWAFSVRSINQDSLNTLNLHYSSIRSIDFAIKGAMSMCVTFINIICIFACGIVILKIKAVAPKQNLQSTTLINEYLNVLKEINLEFPQEEANYLTLRLKEEYPIFGLSPSTVKARGPCSIPPGYNPFDLSFITWSPGYRRQHDLKSFSNTPTDIRTSKLLKNKIKNTDLFNGETTPDSLNAVFKSPMENYPTTVSTDNNTPSTSRRFIITPVTLKNTSNTK
ncbi:uncharacterized protein LOC100569357 isoform X3 [Acyrthosiphon pisum]|uniref:Uncharacterized protein n=1 Tax=Acyrthosiphon pisum TaxID=7029 RepID=A0A8R2F9X7_ACYPI|nr:uncharacterized protein LOC100569357 isoform X3 [Acyrthosiphon pisum]|eukprot:XP_008183091.2 PREDICTED: uncharacterized protein LOC100569357 isoform X3 [Acyrthosiphon pisum]